MHRSRAISAALVLALAVFASPSHAQRRASFGIAAGAALPTDDLGDIVSAGFNLTGTVNVTGTPTMPIGFRIDGMWNQMSENDNSGVEARILSLNGNLVVNFANQSSVTPYVIGGLGIYNTNFDIERVRDFDDDSSTDVGLNGGFGLRFGLSGLSTFAELRFHNVFTDGDGNLRFIPITFGILF
jgi:hypothetical protein